jgi:hypothetical protein
MSCADPSDPGDTSDGIARVEGVGAVTEAWLRDRLGPQARFTEIPDRHRQAVHLMTPAVTFPFASNTTRGKQIDHTAPYQHGEGRPSRQSRLGYYGPMTTHHHRLKTFGGWMVKQPFPGIYLWRDRYGATYLVDHTGTRRVNVEIHHPAHVLEWAA